VLLKTKEVVRNIPESPVQRTRSPGKETRGEPFCISEPEV